MARQRHTRKQRHGNAHKTAPAVAVPKPVPQARPELKPLSSPTRQHLRPLIVSTTAATAKRAHGWRQNPLLWLVLRAAVIAALAVGVDHLLEYTPTYRHFREAGYKSAQYSLMHHYAPPRDGLPVRVLDLSSLLRQKGAPHHFGEEDDVDEEELAGEWIGLADILKDIQAAHPKALLIDWELALSDDYIHPDRAGKSLVIAPSIQGKTREAYNAYMALMQQLAETNQHFPVLVIASNAAQRRQKGLPLFPVPAPSEIGCDAVLSTDPHLVYKALSAHRGLGGLPAMPDALLQRLPTEGPRDSRVTPFWSPVQREQPDEETKEPVYWIDYAYLPTLLKETVSVERGALASPDVQARLKGRIVLLADVTNPHFTDVFPLPLDADEARVPTARGRQEQEQTLSAYTGGLAQACALLTLMNHSLYTLREGTVWYILLFLFNLTFLLLAAGGAWLVNRHEHNEDRAELTHVAVDLLMVLLSAGVLVGLNALTSTTRLLLPHYPMLLTARLLELGAVIFLIGHHLVAHKHPHAGQEHEAHEEQATKQASEEDVKSELEAGV